MLHDTMLMRDLPQFSGADLIQYPLSNKECPISKAFVAFGGSNLVRLDLSVEQGTVMGGCVCPEGRSMVFPFGDRLALSGWNPTLQGVRRNCHIAIPHGGTAATPSAHQRRAKGKDHEGRSG